MATNIRLEIKLGAPHGMDNEAVTRQSSQPSCPRGKTIPAVVKRWNISVVIDIPATTSGDDHRHG